MKSLSSQVVVSDADVIIKLYKAKHLNILELLYTKVIIPGRVHSEILKEVGLPDPLIQYDWLNRINLNDRTVLTSTQIQGIEITLQSYKDALDDGEREAFALAQELGIPVLLIDDVSAKRIIENNSDILGISHFEILFQAIHKRMLTPQDAENIFKDINEVVTYPIRTPFDDLMKRVRKKYYDLELF